MRVLDSSTSDQYFWYIPQTAGGNPAGQSRKNNVWSAASIECISTRKVRIIKGIDNSLFRYTSSNNWSYISHIVPYHLNFEPITTTTMDTFQSCFQGGYGVFQYCNGTVVEIYKV